MQQYDCIWYKPEGRTDALKFVRRLPVAECSRRRLPYGLRFWLDSVQMPLSGFGACSFVVRNFYGSSALNPSSDSIFFLLKIEETTPFYIAANFVVPPHENPTILVAAENEQIAEGQGNRQFEREGGMKSVWLQRGVARYFEAVSVVFRHAPETNEEMKSDVAVLRSILAEDERGKLRNLAHRLKGFFVKDDKLPVQVRFIYRIYPFLETDGAVPGYQPRNQDDPAATIEGYYRGVLAGLNSALNRGGE